MVHSTVYVRSAVLGQAFLSEKVWIDVGLTLIVCGFHAVTWPRGGYSNDPVPRKDAADSITRTVATGITAVGILIPATLVVANIGQPAPSILGDIFFADVWFTASLTLGLYVLWTVGARSATVNVLNRRDVGLVYGWQLFFLFAGMMRLMVGLAGVFGGY